MNHPSKLTLAALALSLSALMSAATASAATAPPKVAFVGDFLTDGWSTSFPANWIDTDVNGQTQMAAAIALKPSLIHIMIGSEFYDDDASYNEVTADLEEALITDITQAQAAGIPVIVGLEPLQVTGYGAVTTMDLIAYAVATKYGVPIVNYSGAFSNAQTGYAGTVNGTPGGTAQAFGGSFFIPNPGNSFFSVNVPDSAGYAIMTMMAQTAFATINAQPDYLYLQDVLLQGNECTGCYGVPNVNTASPGNIVQFYPVIYYNNGASGVGFNSNFLTGSQGTWTSSNPLVGVVNQSGEFWAINEGQTTVKFTLPNGVWNEWIMYVGAPFPG